MPLAKGRCWKPERTVDFEDARSRSADLGRPESCDNSGVEAPFPGRLVQRMALFFRNREIWLRRADLFSNNKWGLALLALIAFADSSVLPVLPDLFLVIASSLGGIVGYGIGHLAWAAFGQTLIAVYGQADNFQRYQKLVEDWGLWLIIAKSLTPIPFKFIAIAAGAASMNLLTFVIATVIGRALHFAIVAALVGLWGQQFLQLIEKYERWLVSLGLVAAIGFGVAYSLR
jgi:membrane protein YqaA with SNARE-associated domain